MDYPGKVITKTQVTPTQTSASGNWTLDDQAAAIKNNNWPVALVPNPISKSLRFNSADSAYLNRTVAAAATSNTLTTLSFWFKRAKLGTSQQLFASATSAPNVACYIELTTSDTLKIYLDMTAGGSDETTWTTSAVFRDVSAWYGATIKVDTSQASNANKVVLYINGVSQTLTASQTGTAVSTQRILENGISLTIGKYFNSSGYGDFYLTEFNCIDGQALTPSSFGMTNPQTGQWIPKKYTGTYGTNGFYVNFKDATSTTTLGYDYSGNANNWTTNNFSVTAGAGNDSLTDVPTPWIAYNTTGDVGGVIRGNYCTLNPLNKNTSGTLSNGNLEWQASTTAVQVVTGTSTIIPSDKTYFEVNVVTAAGASNYYQLGIVPFGKSLTTDIGVSSGNGYAIEQNGNSDIRLRLNGTSVTVSTVVQTGDVLQVAVDYATGKLWFGRNNTWYNSSGGTTGNPGAGTNETATISTTTDWFPAVAKYNTGGSYAINFGQRPFAYTPPTGFRSLCTTNLPATAIGFGLTNQGDDYFNTVLWTGNATARSITGVGFQPDFVWIKNRTTAFGHLLYDVIRGTGLYLASNSTAADTSFTNGLTSFDSDGFGLGTASAVNENSSGLVAWNWKANGTGVTNTAGTITSTVSANTTSGFSVVTWTGAGSSGTIGHGLGVTPSMIIVKNRSGTQFWFVNHTSISATQNLYLNGTDSVQSDGIFTARGATTFGVGAGVAASSTNYVAYCFAAVPGYSAFGSYTGNGSSDGPFVFTGFRPRYVMFKRTNSTGNWIVEDTSRSPYNQIDDYISANASSAGATGAYNVDYLSNGFKLRYSDPYGDTNASGSTYIYMAFAESPFQFANAR